MQQFDELAARLLRGGVAYRHVRRYIAELRDHAEDAARAEMARGASSEQARGAALARLGTMDDLAHGMIARSEFQALSARFPRLWGTTAPVALWVGIMVAILFLIVGATKQIGVLEYKTPQLAGLQGAADIFMWLYVRGLPVVIGGFVLTLALRQRLSLTWPLIGLALLAVLGATTDAAIQFPHAPGTKGELRFGVGFTATETLAVAVRLSAMFGAMLMPLIVRKRLTRLAV